MDYRELNEEAVREATSGLKDPCRWARWLIRLAPVVCQLRGSKGAPSAGSVDCPVCGAPDSLQFEIEQHGRVTVLRCATDQCVDSCLASAKSRPS